MREGRKDGKWKRKKGKRENPKTVQQSEGRTDQKWVQEKGERERFESIEQVRKAAKKENTETRALSKSSLWDGCFVARWHFSWSPPECHNAHSPRGFHSVQPDKIMVH